MTGKLLSPKELEEIRQAHKDGDHTNHYERGELLGHIAALEAERDAALADSVARSRLGAQMANVCYNVAQQDGIRPDVRESMTNLHQQWDGLGPRPGATLLEVTRSRSHVAKLEIDVSGHIGTIHEQHDRITTLLEQAEEHRKALARARNEGLEKAAGALESGEIRWVDADAFAEASKEAIVRGTVRALAKKVRDLKESVE